MSTLFFTLGVAFVVVCIALAFLGIGWLITGKTKLEPGACGKDPSRRQDENECGTGISCALCDKPKPKESKND